MAEIKVTASELRNKAQSLSQLNKSLESQINALQQSESGLNNMWDGEAKTAFHNAFMHDKQEMTEFKQAVDKYVQALEQIAQMYEKAEQQNTQTATNRNYH